jgi:hypothetical protein
LAVNARKQFSQFSHALVSGSIYSLISPCKLLITHTNLSLNVKLINQDVWNENTIAERGKMLAEAATKLYPR